MTLPPSPQDLVNNYTKITTHEVVGIVVSVSRDLKSTLNPNTKQEVKLAVVGRINSYVVYIPTMSRRTFAVDRSLPNGSSNPLSIGDRVLVRFTNGKIENAFISARLEHNENDLAKKGQNPQDVCSTIKPSRRQQDIESKIRSEDILAGVILDPNKNIIESFQQDAAIAITQKAYIPPTSDSQNTCIDRNSVRGLVEYYDSSGNRVAKVATDWSRSSETIRITPLKDENSGKPIAHTRLKEIQELLKTENYNRNISRVYNFKPFSQENKYKILTELTDDDKAKLIEDLRTNYILSELDQLKLDLENIKEIEKCLQTHTKQTKSKTKTLLDKLLDEIVEKGTQELLNQLNNTLPDYLKVNIDIQKNSQDEFVVKSFSVGGVKYVIGEALDGSEDYVVVDGSQFNPLIESGISEVNKLLPDFLQVSASDLGLSFGDIFIRKQELSEEEYQEFSVRDDIILVNNRGAMYIEMQGSKFNFGRVGDLFLDRGLNKGVNELNELLPDMLQVSYRREGDVRMFDIGPFTVTATGPNKGIQVDKEKLRGLIDDLPNQLFNQLPAPLQPSARMLWKEATDFIVDEVLYKKDTERKRKEEQEQRRIAEQEQQRQSISTAIDICLKNTKYSYQEQENGKIDVFLPSPSNNNETLAVTISPIPPTTSPPK